MGFRDLVLFVVLVCLSSGEVSGQNPTTSSVSFEYTRVIQGLIEDESIIRSYIDDTLLPKVNACITSLKPSASLGPTVKALTDIQTFLLAKRTLNDYYANNATCTCSDVAIRQASLVSDNLNWIQIDISAAVNNTNLLVLLGSLYYQSIVQSGLLSYTNQAAIADIIRSMYILSNDYTQYEIALAWAIYTYTRLYVELLYLKKNVCNCPTALSQSSTTAMAVVDDTLVKITEFVDTWEQDIRNISATIIASIDAVNPNLKLTAAYAPLTITLDSIKTLVTGFLNVSSWDSVNQTRTCDESAMKLGFIEYKQDKYMKAQIAASCNDSYVIAQLALLVAYKNYFSSALSASQTAGVNAVYNNVNALVNTYNSYIIALSTSYTNLVSLYLNCLHANYASCNCTGDPTTPTAGPTPAGETTTTTTPETTQSTSPMEDTSTSNPSATTDTTEASSSDTSTTMDTTGASTVGDSTDASSTTESSSSTVLGTEHCTEGDQQSFELNDDSGTYIKTMCIAGMYTQSDADAYCKANNMLLFQIDSDTTQQALFTFLTGAVNQNAVFRVDGIRNDAADGDNNWYYYDFGQAPAFTGLDWLLSSDTLTGLNTLVVTNMGFPLTKAIPTWRIDGLEPTYEFNVICQYTQS